MQIILQRFYYPFLPFLLAFFLSPPPSPFPTPIPTHAVGTLTEVQRQQNVRLLMGHWRVSAINNQKYTLELGGPGGGEVQLE